VARDASRPAQALQGCLLGTAAGDSVGLPFENLSRRSVGALMREPLRQSLVGGWGLVSDDTEHSVMVLLSLQGAVEDESRFARALARRLRWWMAALPPGVGSATVRSVFKLWLGVSPARSGVASAGNGAAMRAAVLGVVFAGDPDRLRTFVRASTHVTHRDPRALEAALAVAVAAACAARRVPSSTSMARHAAWRDAFAGVSADLPPMSAELVSLQAAIDADQSLARFAETIGCADGVSGYALHTVPVALLAWMRHGDDFRAAVTETIRCGGDTDSTAAIVGGLVGAGVGVDGVPREWTGRLLEWPRNGAWMRGLCVALASRRRFTHPLAECAHWPWQLLRNLAMLIVVLGVWVRRTLLVVARQS